MAISLTKKNTKVSLVKEAPSLTKARVGLGWKLNTSGGKAFDLDASVFLTDDSHKVMSEESDFIFYGNLDLHSKGIKVVEHTGDNRTGDDDDSTDEEEIILDLANIPERYKHIYITVSIHESDARGQNFGMVNDAYIRLYNHDNDDIVLKYELTEEFSMETGVIVASLNRVGNSWDFQSLATPVDNDLFGLCEYFGVETE